MSERAYEGHGRLADEPEQDVPAEVVAELIEKTTIAPVTTS